MQCPTCLYSNRDHARFCKGCGVALSQTCRSCGLKLDADSRFCDGCGTAVQVGPTAVISASRDASPEAGSSHTAADALPASAKYRQGPQSYTPKHLADRIINHRAAIEGERKHVTVLFADVAGFTSISEKLDPEEVHYLMDRTFEIILGEVHRYEGTINQFTGDGVMALFGAPVALEDAPRRAIQSALGIQRALATFRAELQLQQGIDFWMRIGINTGMVVVGRIGNDLRMDYTAIGDTTNLAARLQAACSPGGVLIAEATYRLVTGFFDVRMLPAFQVKGKSRPVQSYEVLGKISARSSRLEASQNSGLTPLIGRETELLLLESAFQAACGGQGQLVLIEGEPGIGKTRLLYELRARIGSRKHRWMEGRCVSYGGSSVLLPVADALRRQLDIAESDNDATALGKIEQGLDFLGAERAGVQPYICYLLSLAAGSSQPEKQDPVTMRSELFRSLRLLLCRMAEAEPLVLFMEDLHWIDTTSEEFLDYLLEGLASLPMVLVCSYRPGYQPQFAMLAATKLSLRGLTVAEMYRMSAAVLGVAELPQNLRTLIERKAEGNPLFIEEVSRTLIEQGLLRQQGEQLVFIRDVQEIAVPNTIHDVIAARIDRLAEEPKRTIQLASVIGREFALRLLQSLGDSSLASRALIEELRALSLIYPKAVYPEPAYMFKHALVHDVTYESILFHRRKTLHRLVGQAIEELYVDRLAEHDEVLAHHFTAAEDWHKALEYHERSAMKAAATFAIQTGAEHCKKALEIARKLGNEVPEERRHKLLNMLGTTHFLANEFQTSGEAFERAAETTQEPGERISARANAAFSFTWGHQHERAGANLKTAFSLSKMHHPPAAVAMLHTVHGYREGVLGGNTKVFIDSTAKGMELGDLSGNKAVGAMSKALHAMGLEWVGQFRKSIELNEQALETGRQERLAQIVVLTGWFIAKAACCLGDYGRAIPQLLEILDVTERIGARAWKARLLNTIGWCFSELGAHELALGFNERASTLSEEVGDHEIIANSKINLAMNFLDVGDLDKSLRLLEPLRTQVERGDPFMRWRYGLHLAQALSHAAYNQGQLDKSLMWAKEAHASALRYGAPKLCIRSMVAQGRVLLAQDSPTLAAEAFAEARRLSLSIEYRSGLWRSQGWEAIARDRLGEHQAVERLRTHAREAIARVLVQVQEADLRNALRQEELVLRLSN